MRWIYGLWALVVFAFAAGCTNSEPTFEPETIEEEVMLPTLVGFPQTDVCIDTSEIICAPVFPIAISSRNSIQYDTTHFFRRNWYSKQESVEIAVVNRLKILIDPNQTFADKFHEMKQMVWITDENGNLVSSNSYVPRYDSIAKIAAFIVNTTDSNQIVQYHDGALTMIQEARDESGKWKPIEYYIFPMCGNGHGDYLIPKGEALMFGVNKYKGNFKTMLRVRLITNGTLMFSNEYPGEINPEQFKFKEEDYEWFWNKFLDDTAYYNSVL